MSAISAKLRLLDFAAAWKLASGDKERLRRRLVPAEEAGVARLEPFDDETDLMLMGVNGVERPVPGVRGD